MSGKTSGKPQGNGAEYQPRVSVIMPCHNDGATMEEAVDSLRKQTWSNIELIIIDDGSDDGTTTQVIQNLQYEPKMILHTDHVGPSAARNKGIAAATGDFILPLDADDLIEPGYIETAMNIMVVRPEVGIVYCHADLFGEASGPWELADYSLKAELLDNCIFVTSLFRKADWEAVGGFCEDFKAGMEDYDFWLSIIGLGREVVQLPETLFHYRIKPASRTTRFMHSYADVQETYVRLYQRHRDFYAQHMDEYCMEMRRVLIDQLMINKRQSGELADLQKQHQDLIATQQKWEADPLVGYTMSVRNLKPGYAAFLEKLIRGKDKVKHLLGKK